MSGTIESPTGRSCRQCQGAYLEANKRVPGENNLSGAPHPPSSPDLALSDFFLFGYIKGNLQRTESAKKDDLVAEIREVLNGIVGKVLKAVFVEWEKRMQTCTNAGREYVE
jgi:hypothetical protein